MDDPTMTQPHVYKKITNHPTVRALYANQLQTKGILTQEEAEQMKQNVQEILQTEYNNVPEKEGDSIWRYTGTRSHCQWYSINRNRRTIRYTS
ncbi:hypothetical protein GCM10020331_090520 [Ectobacillus funiculus]